jgi:hypothetical protein
MKEFIKYLKNTGKKQAGTHFDYTYVLFLLT